MQFWIIVDWLWKQLQGLGKNYANFISNVIYTKYFYEAKESSKLFVKDTIRPRKKQISKDCSEFQQSHDASIVFLRMH